MKRDEQKPLKILQICPKPPYPAVDGGSIAMNNITQGLLALGHQVKVLAISTFKYPADETLRTEEYVARTAFETQYVDIGIHLPDVLRSLFSAQPYNVSRFYDKAFEDRIIETVRNESFDVVHFEQLSTVPYLRAVRNHCPAPAVFREHNIEHHIWQAILAAERNQLKKAYTGMMTERLRRYEIESFNRFDAIAAITGDDAEQLVNLGCRTPIEVIPFGIDLHAVRSEVKTEFPAVFHLGAMDWTPNQEAVGLLLDEIWPRVIQRHPELRLYLAGRAMPTWLRALEAKNVTVVGEVSNAYDFMKSKAVMVVPLQSGSGMRIKMVEGMALGKTIVSTRLAAQGIDCTHEKNILFAETPEEFVHWIDKVVSDKSLFDKVGRQARMLVKEKYDNRRIAEKLVSFYFDTINHQKSLPISTSRQEYHHV